MVYTIAFLDQVSLGTAALDRRRGHMVAGPEVEQPLLRYSGERPGLSAVTMSLPDGEIVIRRPAVTPFAGTR